MQSLIEKLIRDQLVIYCLLLWIYLETSSQCSQKPEHSPEPKNSPSRTSTCPFIEYIFNIVLLSTNRSPKFSPSLASSAEDSINLPFTICTTVGKKTYFSTAPISDGLQKSYSSKNTGRNKQYTHISSAGTHGSLVKNCTHNNARIN